VYTSYVTCTTIAEWLNRHVLLLGSTSSTPAAACD